MKTATTKPLPPVLYADRHYISSERWRCSKGGAHHWIVTQQSGENLHTCVKCGERKARGIPDFVELLQPAG